MIEAGEQAICGLRISASPTSDNLTPQETTNQPTPDMGLDGAELSCPCSSVVAEGITKTLSDRFSFTYSETANRV
jgi:hypothetical protein